MLVDRRLTIFMLALLLLPIVAAPLSAQGSAAVFSDTVEVEIVNIEVVVTEKDGRPVTGLTAEDFRLLEDGKPVEITNFYEVQAEAEASDPALEPPTPDDLPLRPVGGTQGLNLVIFVDNLNILPSNRKLLFDNLRKYLQTGGESIDQAMLVSMQNRIEVTVPFSSDMTEILTALDEVEQYTSFQAAMAGEQSIFLNRLQHASTASGGGGAQVAPGGGAPSGNQSFDDAIRVALDLASATRTLAERQYSGLRASVSALSAFASTLGGLPGRKALLYMSDGLSARPNDMLREAWSTKYEQWYFANEDAIRNHRMFPDAAGIFQRMFTGLVSSQFKLDDELDRFAKHASDNQVILYPISVSGRASSLISAEASGPTGAILRAARTTEAMNRDASMMQMASDTGGFAMTNSPNIAKLLDRVGDDFSYYYSLGYQPVSGKRDREFHRIKVEVSQADLEVRHSNGRRRKSWRDRLGDMTAAAAMFSIDTNPLDLRLTAGEQIRQGKRYKVPIMVQIPFENILLVSDGTTYNAQLTVLVRVSDEKGGLSDPQRFDLPIQIPNAQILAARSQSAAYPVELLMSSGNQQVAVSVRDHLAQSASVVSLPVQVGDVKPAKKKKKGKKG